MTSKNTSLQQFDILVSFMETHPEFAKGYNTTADARESSKRLWSEIANRLNSHGPPIRTSDGWKKVWTDFKYNIKRKLKENKQSISSTGGGPSKTHTFSALEETVIRVVHLREAVNGTTGAISLGDTQLNLPTIPLSAISESDSLTNIESEDNKKPTSRRANIEPKEISSYRNNTINRNQRNINRHQGSNEAHFKNKRKKYDLYKKELLLKEKEIELMEMTFKFNKDKLTMESRDRLEERKCKVEELEIKKRKLELLEENDRR